MSKASNRIFVSQSLILEVDETATDNTTAVMIPGNENISDKSDCNSSKTGWLMVSLVFIANFLVFGFFKSLGMLTKILNKEFDATMNVYILMCITYSLNCAAGPLSCYLTRRYTARNIAFLGTSLVTCGLILSWFAQSLTFLYFSVGVFTGIGSGLHYPTGVILVSNYFTGTKNAAIANAMVVSGSPIGGMIMPFVISFLSELYTSRGAFLIIGGVMMHAVLCVRSFRQPEANRLAVTGSNIHTPPPSPSSQSHGQRIDSYGETEDILTIDEDNNMKGPQVHSCSTGVLTIACKNDRGGIDYGNSASAQTVLCPNNPPPPFSSLLDSSGNCSEHGGGNDSATRRRGTMNLLNFSWSSNAVDMHWNSHYSETPNATGSQPYILALDHSCVILCPSNSNTDVIMKQRYPHSQFFESVKSVPLEDAGDIEVDGQTQHVKSQSENAEKPVKPWKFISPLGDPIYVFLLISNTATAISTANIYLMVSQLVDESDDNYKKTSLIYLLISSADLSGRITGAFLCDKKLIPPSVIYAIGLVSAGISSSLLATLTNFVHLCVGTFVYGMSSGFHVGIYGLLLTNIVGLEKIHAGYGISMFINGTIQCIAILLSGRMISMYNKSFSWLAPIFGGILAGGGLIWICGLLIFARKKDIVIASHQETQNADENTNVKMEGANVSNNNNENTNTASCT